MSIVTSGKSSKCPGLQHLGRPRDVSWDTPIQSCVTHVPLPGQQRQLRFRFQFRFFSFLTPESGRFESQIVSGVEGPIVLLQIAMQIRDGESKIEYRRRSWDLVRRTESSQLAAFVSPFPGIHEYKTPIWVAKEHVLQPGTTWEPIATSQPGLPRSMRTESPTKWWPYGRKHHIHQPWVYSGLVERRLAALIWWLEFSELCSHHLHFC